MYNADTHTVSNLYMGFTRGWVLLNKRSDNFKFITDESGNKILLTRNAKIKICLDDEEKFSLSVPFGSRIFFEDGENVKANQLLADWDPYTLPIIAEKDGHIKYIDLQQGISFRESTDDTTGISSKIVIDWSQNPKSKNFKELFGR